MWYDVLVVCILLFFMVKGASRGLVWQLAGIAGILLCITFAGTASKVIGPHINLAPPTNQWAVMFITYMLASLVAFGFARTLNGWIDKMEMKEYNRHLGAVFGLIKGGLLVLVMTFMIVTFSEKTRNWLQDSQSAHIAAKMIHQIEPLIPDKLNAAVGKYIQMFDATGFVAHDPNAEATDILPPEFGSETAPVSEDTSLGKAEPFDPFGVFSGSSTKTPPASTGSGNVSPDLATELRKTVGSKVSQLIQDELQAVSGNAKVQVEQNIADALQSADPQAKRQLQERLLNDGQNGSLVQLLHDWATETLNNSPALPPTPVQPAASLSGSAGRYPPPSSSQPNNPVATPASTGPRTYLDEIVAAKSQFPSIQKKLKAEYTQIFQMLPQQVTSAVIQDWYGDLTNSASDLDPETDSKTALQARIIRQLSAAKYPETQLAPEIQTYLKQFRMTAASAGVLR